MEQNPLIIREGNRGEQAGRAEFDTDVPAFELELAE
jgi:hypothetical protein